MKPAVSTVRRYTLFAVVVALLWSFSLLLMPVNYDAKMYVPPSDFFLHSTFSAKYWYYRHRPGPDLLILGNSRTDAALLPETIENALSQRKGSPLRVVSLATGGGYFPFYHEVLTTLLDRRQLPRRVILGVSPRDFNRCEPRRDTVLGFLKASSGYNLRRVPYAEPFHTIEARLADLCALLLPGFFYRNHLTPAVSSRADTLPGIDALARFPRVQAVLNKWYVDTRMMIPQVPALRSGIRLGDRLKCYVARFGTLTGWDPTVMQISPNGGNSTNVDYSVFAERKKEAMAKRRFLFDPNQTGSPYPNYRYTENFRSEADIWDEPSGAPERTFRFLAEAAVQVYIVIPPACVLEGWENNTGFNDLLRSYLADLRNRYPNIRQVIDMNNNFDHEFLDPELYYDAEHATPAMAQTVSRHVAELMDISGWPAR